MVHLMGQKIQYFSGVKPIIDNQKNNEVCTLLGHYAACSGNFHYMLHNNPEECRSQLLHGGSLRSHRKTLLHANIIFLEFCTKPQTVMMYKIMNETVLKYLFVIYNMHLKDIRGITLWNCSLSC